MVPLNALSCLTLAVAAVEITSAQIVHKRDPRPTPASLYARQDTTGAFSDFSGTLPASISSIISSISSGTPTITAYTVAATYTAGAINPSISNAPALPNREWQSSAIVWESRQPTVVDVRSFSPSQRLRLSLQISLHWMLLQTQASELVHKFSQLSICLIFPTLQSRMVRVPEVLRLPPMLLRTTG
jgi:hypothetical protein